MSMNRERTFVALLAIAAFAARLGVSQYLGLDLLSAPGSDQYDYVRYAANLVAGKGYIGPEPGQAGDVPSAYLPPGTPVFYAALFTLFGERASVLRVAQCLLGASATFSTCSRRPSTRAIAGRPAAGIAAAIFAFYPTSLFYCHELLTETLYVFLLLTFSWICQVRLARTPTWGAAVAAGVVLGATCLTRPTILFFMPPYVVWATLVPRSWKGRGLALIVPLVAASVVAPWSVWASRLYGRFVPVAPTTWTVLIQGNNRVVATDPKYAGYCVWYTDIPEYSHKFDGLNLVEREDLAKALTLEWLRDNQDQIGRLVINKTLRFWSPFLRQEDRLRQLAMLLSWGTVLVLFVPAFCVTLVRGLRDRSPMLWMHLFILTAVSCRPGRFRRLCHRYPMEPFCILLAAMTISHVIGSSSSASGPVLMSPVQPASVFAQRDAEVGSLLMTTHERRMVQLDGLRVLAALAVVIQDELPGPRGGRLGADRRSPGRATGLMTPNRFELA